MPPPQELSTLGGLYRIGICNLPNGVSGYELRDFVRGVNDENIEIYDMYIDDSSLTGWIQVEGEANMRRVYNSLWKLEWKGFILTPSHDSPPLRSSVPKNYAYPQQNQPLYNSSKWSPDDSIPGNHDREDSPLITNIALTRAVPHSPSGYIPAAGVGQLLRPLQAQRYDYKSNPAMGPLLDTECVSVHISRIPPSITSDLLKSWISQWLGTDQNEIKKVESHPSQRRDSKGYAIVTFRTTEMAQYAALNLDAAKCQGHSLKVKLDRNQNVTTPRRVTQPQRGGHSRRKSSQLSKGSSDLAGSPTNKPAAVGRRGFSSWQIEENDTTISEKQSSQCSPALERTSPAVVDGSATRLYSSRNVTSSSPKLN